MAKMTNRLHQLLPEGMEEALKSVELRIPKGASAADAIDVLTQHHLIADPALALWSLRLLMVLMEKPIYAGSHVFTGTQTQYTILRQLLRSPRAKTRNVTIPEGKTLWEIAGLLQHQLGLDSAKLYQLMTSDSLCAAWNIPASTVEGYLYPETYNVYEEITEAQMIDRLLRQHFVVWKKHFDSIAQRRNMSHHEVVTLASIIEAEAQDTAERRRISGVFHNRLRLGMPLQADPTVQYAIGKKRRLTYRDLQINHPYNTYQRPGLPPGPINSPGFGALWAALHPERHQYLYFVVAPDGSGTHIFSETYAEHRVVQPDGTLRWTEVPEPSLKPTEVKIRIRATALNRADLLQRKGLYPPPPGVTDILGLECAGTIVDVGSKAPRR